ncbi:hypothetical protein ACFWFU_06025 [Streptomyces sp. NPDC060235]
MHTAGQWIELAGVVAQFAATLLGAGAMWQGRRRARRKKAMDTTDEP